MSWVLRLQAKSRNPCKGPFLANGTGTETPRETVAEPSSRITVRKRRRTNSKKDVTEGDNSQSSKVDSTTVVRVKHKRLTGMLGNMMSMPEDVFREISYYLGPDDLLQLSRSAKAIRDLLMSKSSRLIWQNAEQAAGLPERPPDLSSPGYASFIFDPFCSRCLKRGSFKYYVVHRVRLCRCCSTECMKLKSELLLYQSIRHKFTLLERLEICSLVPEVGTPNDTYTDEGYFYEPAFFAAFKKYMSLPSADERTKFACDRQVHVQQIILSSKRLQAWLRANKSVGSDNSYSTKAFRRDTIYARLRRLGYSNRDFIDFGDDQDWNWRSLVEQNQPLTEWIWETILPELEEIIRLRRAKRRQDLLDQRCKELIKIMKERFDLTNTDNHCFVTGQEFFELPMVKELIKRDDSKEKFDPVVLAKLEDQVKELSQAWIHSFEARCALSLREELRSFGLLCDEWQLGDSTICRHAASFFLFREYSQIELKTFDQLLREYRWHFYSSLNDSKMPYRFPDFSPYPIASVQGIYKSVLDSTDNQVNHAEVTTLGRSFVCLCCDPVLRKLMTWTELVQHFYKERTEFQKREEHRERFSIAIPNVNDHDENGLAKPAAYTGIVLKYRRIEDVPELNQWITCCTCDKCKRDREPYTRCKDCERLGTYITFSCQETLSVHARQKHLKPL